MSLLLSSNVLCCSGSSTCLLCMRLSKSVTSGPYHSKICDVCDFPAFQFISDLFCGHRNSVVTMVCFSVLYLCSELDHFAICVQGEHLFSLTFVVLLNIFLLLPSVFSLHISFSWLEMQ